MADGDKDFRYMATNDLLAQLDKNAFRCDGNTQQKICRALLAQLEDGSSEVATLAVKCLTPLLIKLDPGQKEGLLSGLLERLSSTQAATMEMAALGLKTITLDLDDGAVAAMIASKCVPPLMRIVEKEGSGRQVQADALDIINSMLQGFGHLLQPFHAKLQKVLLLKLASPHQNVRNRAVKCIGSFSAAFSQGAAKMAKSLIKGLKGADQAEAKRTMLQALAAVSKNGGHRVGKHLVAAVPSCIELCSSSAEDTDELQEAAMQLLESFVLKLPADVQPSLEDILEICVERLAYDPNYEYDDEDDEDEAMDEDSEEDEYDDEDFSDDEDSSWKVRTAAAKTLAALAGSSKDLPPLYGRLSPVLCGRFKEREEGVRLEVFRAQAALLAGVAGLSGGARAGALAAVEASLDPIFKALMKQVREKSVKVRTGAFGLLTQLAGLAPAGLAGKLGEVYAAGVQGIADKHADAALQLEVLQLLSKVLDLGETGALVEALGGVGDTAAACINHSYFKLIAEGLNVTTKLAAALEGAGDVPGLGPCVAKLYDAAFAKLKMQDIDQNVKDSAMLCVGALLSKFGNLLDGKVEECLPVIVERMNNNVTRLTAVLTFKDIVSSPLGLDVGDVLDQAAGLLGQFLRQADLELRVATLATLMAVLDTEQPVPGIDDLIAKAVPLIDEKDLLVAASAFGFFNRCLQTQPKLGAKICKAVLPGALKLIVSPLLQGAPLKATLEFLALLVDAKIKNTGFTNLYSALVGIPTASLGVQSHINIGQGVAALCGRTNAKAVAGTVNTLLSDLTEKAGTGKMVPLFCLAEIGRGTDLSSYKDLDDIIMQSFEDGSEEVKSAASYALGSVALGNLQHFLPRMLERMNAEKKLKYLLLLSLKEVIAKPVEAKGDAQFSSSDLEQVLELLLEQAGSEEDSARNIVSECLGKLAIAQPVVLDDIEKLLSSMSDKERATAATAFKHAVSSKHTTADEDLAKHLGALLELLGDENGVVKQAAIQAVTQCLLTKSRLAEPSLPTIVPAILGLTPVNKVLFREVVLGPFKQVVDDGLPLRRAAYECLDALVNLCPDDLPADELIPAVVSGITDHFDMLKCSAISMTDHFSVKGTCHRILAKVAGIRPERVLDGLDKILAPVEKTLAFKLKSDAVKQDVEKVDEMKAGALSAVVALAKIEGIAGRKPYVNFQDALKANPDKGLFAKFEAMQGGGGAAGTSADPMMLD